MIELKTSVLLAASLQMGAIMGGASDGNCKHIYEFGRNLGIAFQIQDDYLDAFGNPEKFGKKTQCSAILALAANPIGWSRSLPNFYYNKLARPKSWRVF